MTQAAEHLREESPGFREALLKSERLRIQVVLAVIVAAFAIRSLRTAVLLSQANLHLWAITSLFIAILAGYELVMLRAVRRALKAGTDLPQAVWRTNIVVETSMPALALVFLTGGSVESLYRPLANPAVLLFFIFIILSTLRLDPAVCRIAGGVAAASYLLAAAYLGWTPAWSGGTSMLSPQKAVVGFALSFVVGGFVAGAVAGEIRKQVEAALREAETKREVERLEHDLEVARSIQQSLLPTTTPQIEGFEIAGWNQPADQTGETITTGKCFPMGDCSWPWPMLQATESVPLCWRPCAAPTLDQISAPITTC